MLWLARANALKHERPAGQLAGLFYCAAVVAIPLRSDKKRNSSGQSCRKIAGASSSCYAAAVWDAELLEAVLRLAASGGAARSSALEPWRARELGHADHWFAAVVVADKLRIATWNRRHAFAAIVVANVVCRRARNDRRALGTVVVAASAWSRARETNRRTATYLGTGKAGHHEQTEDRYCLKESLDRLMKHTCATSIARGWESTAARDWFSLDRRTNNTEQALRYRLPTFKRKWGWKRFPCAAQSLISTGPRTF